MTNKTKKTIVVLGSPRGGTSMCAGVLRILGINMGDRINVDKHEDMDIFLKPPNEVIQIIKKNNSCKDVWGWKDPWVGKYISKVANYIINPKFIVIDRDINISAVSDNKKNINCSIEQSLSRNTFLKNNIEIFLKNNNPSIYRYNNEWAVENKEQFVKELIEFIEIDYNEKDFKKAQKFINKEKGYQAI